MRGTDINKKPKEATFDDEDFVAVEANVDEDFEVLDETAETEPVNSEIPTVTLDQKEVEKSLINTDKTNKNYFKPLQSELTSQGAPEPFMMGSSQNKNNAPAYTPPQRALILGTVEKFEENPIFKNEKYRDSYFNALGDTGIELKDAVEKELAIRKVNMIATAPLDAAVHRIKEGLPKMDMSPQGVARTVVESASKGENVVETVLNVATKPIAGAIEAGTGALAVTPSGAAFVAGMKAIEEASPEVAKKINNVLAPTTAILEKSFQAEGKELPDFLRNIASVADLLIQIATFQKAHNLIKGDGIKTPKLPSPEEQAKVLEPREIEQAAQYIQELPPEKLEILQERMGMPEVVEWTLKENALEKDLQNLPQDHPLAGAIAAELVETKNNIETKIQENVTAEAPNILKASETDFLNQEKVQIEELMPTLGETGKAVAEKRLSQINETLNPKINEKEKVETREELLVSEETEKSDLATQAEGEKSSPVSNSPEIGGIKGEPLPKTVDEMEFSVSKKAGGGNYYDLNDGDIRVVEKPDGSAYVEIKGEKNQSLNNTGYTRELNITDFETVNEAKEFAIAQAKGIEQPKQITTEENAVVEEVPVSKEQEITELTQSLTKLREENPIQFKKDGTPKENAKPEIKGSYKAFVDIIEQRKEDIEAGKTEADKVATDNGFKNKSELLNSVKKHTVKTFENVQDIPADVIAETVKKRSEAKPESVSETKPFPKAERIKQLEDAIAEIDAERIAEKNDKIRDFTYRDYQAELEKLKKKESEFLANQETAKRGDLYKVAGNPFAKFEIIEKLEATKEEIELGEQPVKIKNIKSGEIETVLESDLKKVEPKKVSEKDVKEKFTAPVVQTGGISFPIDIEPPRNIIQKHLTKEGNLPKEVFKDWIDTQGKINSQLEQINFTQKDFNSAVKKAYGKTALGTPKVTKAQIEQINDVLSNNLKDIDKLPEPIQEIVTDMRHQIDALSKELQRSGILTESGIAKVDENLGFYLTRSYRLHSDKSWNWNTIPDEVKIKAAQLILKEHPTKSLEQVEGILKSYVNNREIAWDISSGGSTLGAKDLGILKARKDIPVEIREFLGEYKDPFYNYATSISKMSNLIERHKFLEKVKENGEDTWLFEEPTGDFNVKIAAEGSKTLEPLNGLYTTKELAQAFKDFGSPQQIPDWLRYYMMANSVVKYSKTILSPITHARNFTSNFMLQGANGRLDFGAGIKTFETIKNKITNLDDVTFREYYKELAEKRVIDQSVHANELRANLQDAMKYMEDFEKYGDNFIKKIGKKPLQAAEKAYLLEDNIHKIYAYEVEKNRYKHLGEEDAKTKAAEIVRLTMPTYSEVPLAIRNLRRFPLTGTFVTFPYEILRTSYNTIELAIKEMEQPETRTIGAQRLVGFMAAATVTGTLSALTRSKNGMSKEDEQDMRRFFAPWTTNSDILFLDNKGNGVYTYMDLGYSDPYNYLKKPANSILKGHRDQDLIDAAVQFAEPFLGEELLAGKLMDLARNKKASSGGQVYNPELPRGQKWGQILSYLFESLEPGAISSAKRINDAFKKKINEYGGTGDPENEILGVISGQRINTLDVGRSYKFRTNTTGKRLYQAVNIYNSKRYDEGVTEQEKTDARIEAQKAVDLIVNEAILDYSAAMKLGVPQKKLDDALDAMYLEKYKANSDIKKAIKRGVPLYLDSKGKLDRTKRD